VAQDLRTQGNLSTPRCRNPQDRTIPTVLNVTKNV
jgi:hypothetical protein